MRVNRSLLHLNIANQEKLHILMQLFANIRENNCLQPKGMCYNIRKAVNFFEVVSVLAVDYFVVI